MCTSIHDEAASAERQLRAVRSHLVLLHYQKIPTDTEKVYLYYSHTDYGSLVTTDQGCADSYKFKG